MSFQDAIAAARPRDPTGGGTGDTAHAPAERHRAKMVLFDILSWDRAELAELHLRMEAAMREHPDDSIVDLFFVQARAIQNERPSGHL